MPKNAILVHVDYAESYENKQQDECQSAYFGHTQFSIFTAAAYIRYQGELVKESVVIVSEAKDHSRIAAHTCIQRVVDELISIHVHLQEFPSVDLHIWSDGCSAQFRSKFVFCLTSVFPERFNVTRYYNERHHGKGPMDGIGGCVKNVVYRAVMAGREVITTPKEFAVCADRLVKGIRCIYLPVGDVMIEPDNVKDAPYSTDMHILQVHMAKRLITNSGFHCLQLFRIASDDEPFHDQWYRRNDGVEPCGHFDIPNGYDIHNTCGRCLEGENGSSWMQCPICAKWYHDGCFYSSIIP